MKKVFLSVLLLAFVLFYTGCEVVYPEKVSRNTTTPKTTVATTKTAKKGIIAETQAKTEIFKIGDSVKAGNLIFTVN